MKCPKCGQICRNNRDVCALCGTPLKQKKGHGWLIAIIVLLTLILVGLLAWQYLLKDLLASLDPGHPAELVETEDPVPAENKETTETPETTEAPQNLAWPGEESESAKELLFENAAEIYAMPSYTLALCRDGTVKLAGQSASPEFGFDLFDWKNIKQLVPTAYFIAGLTGDGRVRLTGEVAGYEEAAGWTDVARLYFDYDTLLGLTVDGRVLAAGPELAYDPSELKDIVDIIPAWGDSLAVAADGRVTVLRRMGMLWDAGGLYGLAQVALGSEFALYLMEDGSVRSSAALYRTLDGWGWENPYYGWDNMKQLMNLDFFVAGLTRDGRVLCATHIPGEWSPDTSAWTGVVKLFGDRNRTVLFALTEDGRVLSSLPEELETVCSWENVVDLQFNQFWIAALTGDGRVLTWAWDESFPAPDTSAWTGVSAISLGDRHLVGLREDGGVLAAGDNSFGQCG